MSPSLSVIFADSNRELRNTMRGQFELLGLITFLAATGYEAIGFATGTQARLVLLSLHLPHANGFEACERMRVLPGYADVPILLMAPPDVPRLSQKARRAGASAVVFKPFSVRGLLREIEPFLLDPDRVAAGLPRSDDERTAPPQGFSETAMVWHSGPLPQRKYGEESRLARHKLALDVYRQSPEPPMEPRRPAWPHRR